jgi:hypothetical protein
MFSKINSLREWQKIPKDPEDFIVQASVQDGSDGWTNFPIGMSHRYKTNYETIGNHQNLLLCAISSTTDKWRRPRPINRESILKTLAKNKIRNVHLGSDSYFKVLPSFKFVVSPEGNGIDCHRHYEALMAGCIPIVEDNPKTREKYSNLPILYTKDYSEIKTEYLNAKYTEMIDVKYDFAKLFLSSYSDEQKAEIKSNGNYWMTKCTGKPYYS